MPEAREKMITVRFPNTCRKCGKPVEVGSRGYWKPGSGISHAICPEPPKPIEIKKPTEIEAKTRVIEYAELRKVFTEFCKDRYSVYKGSNSAADSLYSGWQTSHWVGISIAEMQDFIDHGYRVAGLDQVSGLIPTKPRRKLVYAEEGDELMIDLALNGEDNPFQTWEKRSRKPGLVVEIHATFSAVQDAKLINAYQRWIARALQTLDENGVDMEIQMVTRTDGAGNDYGVIRESKVRVRKAGEASDFSNWSAMFSPGGYRMLGILGSALQVISEGKTVSTGHGRPLDYGSFTVDYDGERNVMVIGNKNGGEFPESEMTDKLAAILTKLSG